MPAEPNRPAAPAAPVTTGHRALEREFEPFGERAGMFVRSLLTLVDFPGDLSNYVAEPTVRIVRGAFGKWSIDLLLALAAHRHSSFGELRRLMPGVSDRVLSAKLRRLEEAGMVDRSVVPSRPPRPEYVLTDRAQALVRLSAKVLAYARTPGSGVRPRASPSPPPKPTREPVPEE